MMDDRIFLFLALFSLFSMIIQAKERVPVLIWTSDSATTFPRALAGITTSRDDFEKEYIDDLATNVVIFVQDQLSLIDITSHGDVYGTDESTDYKHLKMIMSDYHSTVLPRVINPTSAIENLRKRLVRTTYRLQSPFKLDDLPLDHEGQNLIIIDLPETHGDKAISHIDKILGSVTKQIKKLHKPFTAIYTAKKPRQTQGGNLHQGRQLLWESSIQDDSLAKGVKPITNYDGFMLFTYNITIGNATVELEKVIVKNFCGKENVTRADGINCTVTLDLGNVDNLQEVMLEFMFATSSSFNAGYWYVKELTMSYVNSTHASSRTTASMSSSLVDPTPMGYSYHCFEQPDVMAVVKEGQSGIPSIKFDNFQIQAFMPNNRQFGFYNDCIGFFSIPIWMFIISTIIMLAILFFGIYMLSSITTMDRYEDPKGKSITVNAAD